MKKILLLTICALAFSLTAFSQENNVVKLNKADFLTKVFNYEKNKDRWVYEGTKPCIIDFQVISGSMSKADFEKVIKQVLLK